MQTVKTALSVTVAATRLSDGDTRFRDIGLVGSLLGRPKLASYFVSGLLGTNVGRYVVSDC